MSWYKPSSVPIGGKSQIVCTAIVLLDAVDRTYLLRPPSEIVFSRLKEYFPSSWEIKASHVILNEGRVQNPEDIGKEILLSINCIYKSNKNLLARVSSDDIDLRKDCCILLAKNKEDCQEDDFIYIPIKTFNVLGFISEIDNNDRILI